MISFSLVLALLALCSGLGSFVDRRFLGLVVGRTGPLIGYGFLTLTSDGFKLCAKNPWISYGSLVMAFLALGLETIPLSFLPHCLEPGLAILALLGTSGSLMLLSSSRFRGYSPLGRSRIRTLMFLGEGIFSFVLFCLAFLIILDGLFMMEQDSLVLLSWIAFPGLGMSFLMMCIGERHPWDIPESESDLGGGFGVIYGGFSFLWFAVLEYRWLIHFISFCALMKWAILSHTITLFILRGLLPRYSFQALANMLWWQLPWAIFSWSLLASFNLAREDCFLCWLEVFQAWFSYCFQGAPDAVYLGFYWLIQFPICQHYLD
uniref:NADH dehydrogenase subunit 1 n=1 Tax=Kudoa hexapunctata TaxID=1450334 RepID=A0A0H5BIF2_9CNID|nr:NADH dehydrogenase subunit 1 [Kudoa hexapunctata]BAR94699.1 NADH dehydrogenase subunit 1 [Kudoa hexapunctata]